MAVSSISVSVSASGALNPGGPKKASAASLNGNLNITPEKSAEKAGQSRNDDAAQSAVPGSNADLRASADTSRKLSDAASINNIGLNSAEQVSQELDAVTALTKKLKNSNYEDKQKIKTEIDTRLQEVDRINTETKKAIGSGNAVVTAVFDSGDPAQEKTTTVITSAPSIGRSDLGLTSLTGATAEADPTTAEATLNKAAESVRHELARLSGNNVDLQAISAARGGEAETRQENRISDEQEATQKATDVAQRIRDESAPVTSNLRPEKVQSLIVESSLDSNNQTAGTVEAQITSEAQTREKVTTLLGL